MKFISYNNQSFKKTKYYDLLPKEERRTFDILSTVYHFKVNNYVCENLIDWDAVPNDPIYRFVFPRKEMLSAMDFAFLGELYKKGMDRKTQAHFVNTIRNKVAPRSQVVEKGFPSLEGETIKGMYQRYPGVVTLFPDPMVKTCHSYCSYCFRWIMFNNSRIQKNSSYRDPNTPVAWLKANPEVTNVLFSGADPLILTISKLKEFIEPILEVESIKEIEINSKSLAWWPWRYTTDKDADEVLKFFESIRSRGKRIVICGHFTHPHELVHPEVEKAAQRILATGVRIKTQAPLVKGVNDSAQAWSRMWNRQAAIGMDPGYLFIEADHHPESCFRIPIAKALDIYQEAMVLTDYYARTAIGPLFIYDLNQVVVSGKARFNGEDYFVLKTLKSPPGFEGEEKVKLLPYDENASNFGDLFTLFGEKGIRHSCESDLVKTNKSKPKSQLWKNFRAMNPRKYYVNM